MLDILSNEGDIHVKEPALGSAPLDDIRPGQPCFSRCKTRALGPGSISIMQPGTRHYVWTNEETIGQVHSIGPWSVNYVNPNDAPAKK